MPREEHFHFGSIFGGGDKVYAQLLRKVFDYGYDDIAEAVGKSAPNCCQLVHRARQSLIIRKPRAESSSQ